MSSGADSFNATGPTVVAFETTSADTPVLQSFGVSVVGTICGVFGQATNGAQKDRRQAPSGTGVYGTGELQGVLGTGFTVGEDDTPDFGASPAPEPFGVLGVNSAQHGDAPAIFGDNNILRTDMRKFPNVSLAVEDEAARLAVGVAGVSWAGFGVYGISLNLDPGKSADLTLSAGVATTASGEIPDAIDPPVRNITRPAGLLGLSQDGAGVRGASRFDRGGIFQSSTVRYEDGTTRIAAQIRLVPHRALLSEDRQQHPRLPRDGQTGDLLAIVPPDGNLRYMAAELWFCERGRSPSGAAVWRKVQFADSVVGTV
jgi:hypothetical protein